MLNISLRHYCRRIITAGADGDIRIWNGINDDDPTSHCVGEFVLGVAHYDERVVASTDLNTVQAYTFPAFDRDGTEFRFTAPVICIRVNKMVRQNVTCVQCCSACLKKNNTFGLSLLRPAPKTQISKWRHLAKSTKCSN